MSKKLTKEDLDLYGITVEINDEDIIVKRKWWKNNSTRITTEYFVKIVDLTNKHPYGKDKTYKMCIFGYKSQTISIPLHRIVYAYFKGDIPEGYDVDHIDNNPFNNHPDNLQLLSRIDNLSRRVTRNQFTQGLTDDELIARRVARDIRSKRLKEINTEIKRANNGLDYWREHLKNDKAELKSNPSSENKLKVFYSKELIDNYKEQLIKLRKQKKEL